MLFIYSFLHNDITYILTLTTPIDFKIIYIGAVKQIESAYSAYHGHNNLIYSIKGNACRPMTRVCLLGLIIPCNKKFVKK